MATETIILENANEYYPLAAAGEDFYATNSSSYTMHLFTGPKPADGTRGHKVHGGHRISPDPAITEAYWIMCSVAGVRVSKN